MSTADAYLNGATPSKPKPDPEPEPLPVPEETPEG